MKRFQFVAALALGFLLLAAAPAPAADVILLPGTTPEGQAADGAPAGPVLVRSASVVGGAVESGARGARRLVAGGGAGSGTVSELLATRAISRNQARSFQMLIARITAAQAGGRAEEAVRARRSFRSLVERFVRAGTLSPGAAQHLLEAV